MKSPRRTNHFQILLFLVAATMLWSCLTEVQPYEKEPAVRVRFFNMDSLAKVNIAIAALDTVTKHLNLEKTTLASSLTQLNASLKTLNAEIADGKTNLIPDRDSVQLLITQTTTRQAAITAGLAAQAAAKTRLNKVVSAITKGKILVSKIIANGNEISFSDSASLFSLPLNMNANSQIYYIEIAGKVDSLELLYSFEEELTTKSYTRLIVTEIQRTESYSFDSVKVYCRSLPDACPGNETTVNVYF